MSFRTNQITSPDALSRFEREIQFGLPDSYRNFLSRHNGGVFVGEFPTIVIPNCPTLCVGSLFGLETPSALNLEFWFRRYRDELPGGSLIIGGDPGGAFYLLIGGCDSRGVHFYDHAHEWPSSNSEKNTYFVSPSFDAFATMIGLPA